jgi:zinc protease
MRFPSTRRGRLPGLPLAATFLLCAVGLTALPARPGTLERAQITERVFPSGLRLVVKEAHATDLACVQVWVRAGGFQESATSSGTAHVIEHLVFKGTEVRGPGAIDAEIENLGGLLEASTDKDWSRFGCTVAGRFAPQVIQIIGDAVRKPQFRPADWEAEKPVILEEIAQVRISPESYVGAQLYELAFDKHPYRLDVRGTAPNVSRLNLDTVRAAYKRSYAPGNMTMVVVGHVETAAIERAVSAALGSEPPAAPSAAGPRPPPGGLWARPPGAPPPPPGRFHRRKRPAPAPSGKCRRGTSARGTWGWHSRRLP